MPPARKDHAPHHHHLLPRDQKDHVSRFNQSRGCPFAFGSCFGFDTSACCSDVQRLPEIQQMVRSLSVENDALRQVNT
jgi:hypothetical protein